MGFIRKKKEAERKLGRSLRRPVTFEPEVTTDYTRLMRARHARRSLDAIGLFWTCAVACAAVATLALSGVA